MVVIGHAQIEWSLLIFSISAMDRAYPMPVGPIKTFGPDPSFLFASLTINTLPCRLISILHKLYGVNYPHSSLSLRSASPSSRLIPHSHAMMEENTHEEPAQDSSADAALKKQRTPVIDDYDDVLAWLLMEGNDSDCELSNLLEPVKDTAKGTVKVRFIENPYSSLLVFQSSSSYITINGNEESCGSSFSDSDTSMMASVDMSGLRLSAAFGNMRCTAEEEKTREQTWVSGEGMDGFDDFYWDDQVLSRFLDEQVFSDSEKI